MFVKDRLALLARAAIILLGLALGCGPTTSAEERVQDRLWAEQTRIAASASLTQLPTPPPTLVPVSTSTPIAPRVLSEQEAVARVLPAVVRVIARGGSGSGVIVDAEGLVVTNEHVVGRASSVEVRLRDGRSMRATVVQRNAEADLATLRLEESGLPTAPLGDVDHLALGEPLLAIGYALGLRGDPSITRGVFSGLRTGPRVDYVQTDAAMNPGNSGGPLISLRGEVVGINTFGIARARGQLVEGVNFAISVNAVKDLLSGTEASVRIRPASTTTPVAFEDLLSGAVASREEPPDETIRRYYRLIDARDYATAYELMSANVRGSVSIDTFRGWFTNKVSIQAEQIGEPEILGGKATVIAVVVSSDRLSGPSGRVTTARYREQWTLVYEGAWRLDAVETTRLAVLSLGALGPDFKVSNQ